MIVSELLAIFVALLLGVLAGTITGLTPGLHINLVAVLAVAGSALLPSVDPFFIVLFIVSMGITHSFLDFIPSTFIGVPSSETALSVLPAHRMLLQGHAQRAVYLTLLGSLGSFLLCVLFLPIFLLSFPIISELLRGRLGVVLFFLTAFLLVLDSRTTELSSLILVFMLSGLLGYAALNAEMQEPLFPLLSGLFGVSIILSALAEKSRIPPQQRTSFIEMLRTHRKRSHLLSLAVGSLTGFLPGLGSSHASVLANTLARSDSEEDFLVVQGGINTVNFFVSLVTLFSIGKARNGALLAAQKVLPSFSFSSLLVLVISLILVVFIATVLGIVITKYASTLFMRIDYPLMLKILLVLLILATVILSGWTGVFLLITATMVGTVALRLNVPKHVCMACILVPVMVWTL